VPRSLRPTAVALAVLALAGCAGEPEPDPEAFWTELRFFTDLPEDHRDQAVAEGRGVCTLLAGARPSQESGADPLAAAWRGWADEMGAEDAGFFWETAVEHLCPGQAGTFERVRRAGA
jgi:Protein of unknown function (DUF732)